MSSMDDFIAQKIAARRQSVAPEPIADPMDSFIQSKVQARRRTSGSDLQRMVNERAKFDRNGNPYPERGMSIKEVWDTPIAPASDPEGTVFGDVAGTWKDIPLNVAEGVLGTERLASTGADQYTQKLDTIGNVGSQIAQAAITGGGSLGVKAAQAGFKGRAALGAGMGLQSQLRTTGLEDPMGLVTAPLAGFVGGGMAPTSAAGVGAAAGVDLLTGVSDMVRRDPRAAGTVEKISRGAFNEFEPGEASDLAFGAGMSMAPGVIGNTVGIAANRASARQQAARLAADMARPHPHPNMNDAPLFEQPEFDVMYDRTTDPEALRREILARNAGREMTRYENRRDALAAPIEWFGATREDMENAPIISGNRFGDRVPGEMIPGEVDPYTGELPRPLRPENNWFREGALATPAQREQQWAGDWFDQMPEALPREDLEIDPYGPQIDYGPAPREDVPLPNDVEMEALLANPAPRPSQAEGMGPYTPAIVPEVAPSAPIERAPLRMIEPAPLVPRPRNMMGEKPPPNATPDVIREAFLAAGGTGPEWVSVLESPNATTPEGLWAEGQRILGGVPKRPTGTGKLNRRRNRGMIAFENPFKAKARPLGKKSPVAFDNEKLEEAFNLGGVNKPGKNGKSIFAGIRDRFLKTAHELRSPFKHYAPYKGGDSARHIGTVLGNVKTSLRAADTFALEAMANPTDLSYWLPGTKHQGGMLAALTRGESDPEVRDNNVDTYRRMVFLKELAEYELPRQLRQIANGDQQELKMPGGMSADEVKASWAELQQKFNALPIGQKSRVTEAIGLREELLRNLTEALVKVGKLDPEMLKNPRYYHHEVLKHLDTLDEWVAFQEKRTGTSAPYSTHVMETDAFTFGTMLKALTEERIRQEIANSELNILPQLKREALAKYGSEDAWSRVFDEMPNKDEYKPSNFKSGMDIFGMSPVELVRQNEIIPFAEHELAKLTKVNIGLDDLVAKYSPPDPSGKPVAKSAREPMVLRKDLAKQLEDINDISTLYPDSNAIDALQTATSWWKKAVLLGLDKAIPYTIRASIGDISSMAQYAPTASKYMLRSFDEVQRAHSGEGMSQDYADALRNGVFDGTQTQEMLRGKVGTALGRKIERAALISMDTLGKANPVKAYQAWTKLWGGVNQSREEWFRLSIYKHFLENPDKMGVSDPAKVNAEPDPKMRAAIKAKDLLIDYDGVSFMVKRLTQFAYPFARFQIGNMSRAFLALKNAATIGTTSERVRAILGRLAMMIGMYAAPFIPQFMETDASKKMTEYDRRKGSIPVGDGEKPYSVRWYTDMSDIARITGLADVPKIIENVKRGMPIGQAVKEWAANTALLAVTGSAGPVFSNGYELVSGKAWPYDSLQPRPRTRLMDEKLADQFGIIGPYTTVQGWLSKGTGGALGSQAVQKDRDLIERALDSVGVITNDPGENAMRDSYGIVGAFRDRHGIAQSGAGGLGDIREVTGRLLTKGSAINSTYAVRQSVLARKNNDKSGEKYWNEQAKSIIAAERTGLESKPSDVTDRIQNSIDGAHPLSSLSAMQTRALAKEATPEDRAKMIKAYDHYLSVYQPSERERKKVSAIMLMLQNPDMVVVNDDPIVPRESSSTGRRTRRGRTGRRTR